MSSPNDQSLQATELRWSRKQAAEDELLHEARSGGLDTGKARTALVEVKEIQQRKFEEHKLNSNSRKSPEPLDDECTCILI
jgi:hypothetical protein